MADQFLASPHTDINGECARCPGEPAIINLDGENLCHACAGLWARGEAHSFRDMAQAEAVGEA